MADYNQPWHTETEFENFSRLTVGSLSSDHLTADTWSECRYAAEAEILTHVTDGNSPNRLMLSRVPGELVPQHHPILSDTENQTFTLSIPDVVTTPSSLKPIVWKNLEGPWENRWQCIDIFKLEETTNYTQSGSTITILSPKTGDRYTVEYGHTLNPVPGILNRLSMIGTIKQAIINKFGIDHSRMEQWSNQYGRDFNRQLRMLWEGQLQIPEFASVNLYNDWKENPGSVVAVDIRRN